ncbi:MAG: peptide-methionine (S)-S-oxide reductase MsrA [Planctomycetota bacterium]
MKPAVFSFVPFRTTPALLTLLVLTMNMFACSRSYADPATIEKLKAAPQPGEAVQAEGVEVLNEAGDAVAVFAGGCFWCTEHVYEQIKGVTSVVSGYAGGSDSDANYQLVSAGATEHAEAIKITYDPAVLGYGDMLRIFFTVAHNPTQLNRQGPDVGKQYRSAVFYLNDAQKLATQAYIDQLTEAGTWGDPIVTTLEPLPTMEKFHVAEKYHQDYVQLNPGNPYVVFNALPKVDKLKKALPEYLDEPSASGESAQ